MTKSSEPADDSAKKQPNRLTPRQLAKIQNQRPLGEIFVENVRRIMDEEGITQRELAAACGKNDGTLHGILKGQYDCSLSMAALIAKALDRKLEELFSYDLTRRTPKTSVSL